MTVNKRHQREFHDAYYSDDKPHPQAKYYSVGRDMHDKYAELVYTRCNGRTVLDYCCGTGDEAIELAKRGAHVVGIDISPVAIQTAEKRARQEGIADRIEFYAMDAERLNFDNDSFDVIVGLGALHHLDLRSAFPELARVLKPDGFGVFSDPLAYNPIINLYRQCTPEARTHDEHRLVRHDFDMAGEFFGDVQVWFFTLAVLGAVPFRRFAAFPGILTFLEHVDQLLFTVPGMRWLAWACVYRLGRPRK